MERFLIQVNREGSYYDPLEQVFFMNQEVLADFFSILNDLNISNEFRSSTVISCELCDSSIIGAKEFHEFVARVFSSISRSSLFSGKYPGMDLLFDDLSIICSYLTRPRGLNGVESGSNSGENPEGFAYEDLGLIMNPACSCYSIIAQKIRA